MKILRFKLSGNTAFFKKPDVNGYVYFTYGCIHKVAVLGILGAILGYSGYNSNNLIYEMRSKKDKSEECLPEFYQRLNDIKISIVPLNDKGFIPKKIQTFNNSVGYASQEKGGNLIIKEQWLDNPKWDIYVMLDNEESLKIADCIMKNRAVFIPYLGKNDHFADITDAKIFDNIEEDYNAERVDSLCLKDSFIFKFPEEDEIDFDNGVEDTFKYEEKLPYGINDKTGMYMYNSYIYTNMIVIPKNSVQIYKVKDKNIIFY